MTTAKQNENSNTIVSIAIVASTAAVIVAIESSLPGNMFFTAFNVLAIGAVIAALVGRSVSSSMKGKTGRYSLAK